MGAMTGLSQLTAKLADGQELDAAEARDAALALASPEATDRGRIFFSVTRCVRTLLNSLYRMYTESISASEKRCISLATSACASVSEAVWLEPTNSPLIFASRREK